MYVEYDMVKYYLARYKDYNGRVFFAIIHANWAYEALDYLKDVVEHMEYKSGKIVHVWTAYPSDEQMERAQLCSLAEDAA